VIEEEIAAAIDDKVVTAMSEQEIPGLSLAVIYRDAISICKGYGRSNVELDTPTEASTVYKIGSISKQFLSSAVMLLVRDGVLKLDGSLQDFFGPLPREWQPVTIRHLLTHTAGLPRDPMRFDPYIDRPIIDYVTDAFKGYPLSMPGDTWAYSNLGYFVVAEIIQRATAMPFDTFVRRHIFEPAMMHQTSASRSTDIVPGRASSYLIEDGILRNAGELRALRPSGAFLSSVADLARWTMALLNGHIFEFPLLQELSTPARLNSGEEVAYGYGLFLGELNGKKLLRHGGGLWCFRAEILILSELDLAVVVMANSREADVATLALEIATNVQPVLYQESPQHLFVTTFFDP